MIVTTTINKNKVGSKYRITHIDETNYLDFAKPNSEIAKGLSKYQFLLSHTPYRYTLSLRNKVSALINQIRNTKYNK
jgi:hypothetical protein